MELCRHTLSAMYWNNFQEYVENIILITLLLLSYLVNKLEIRWLYLSPIEYDDEVCQQCHRKTYKGYDLCCPLT